MKKVLILLALFTFIISCSEDKSSNAEILEISVNSFSNSDLIFENTFVDTENNKVYLFINNNLNDFTFPISINANVKLSPGAKTKSLSSDEISFSKADEVKLLEVEAEDGSLKNWYVYLVHQQIQNSDFEDWFDNQGMNSKIYKEIGASSISSVWATANMGTSIYDVHCTQPIMDGTNTMVEIVTGETTSLPITTGTIFTGLFNVAGAISNPTDPEKATVFGTPFIFRPKGFKFKFKYQAGERYIQATLNNPSNIFGGFSVTDISGEDQCSIYAYLEIRDGDQITEIARVKMESGTTVNSLTETELIFPYNSNLNPTHLTIVFSSSTGGAEWRGAVGSTLVIDDLELIYE
ncbi:MAG TPA: hypothetical protein DCG75_00055 [Bacteroidales bacterium]|nr:hypothetical protein [Bacteroidales bacterium]